MFLFLVASVRANGQAAESPEGHLNRLVREAAGNRPIQNIGSASQIAFDSAFRAQYRRLIEVNRSYARAQSKIHADGIRQLSTPESLANPDGASANLRQLHLAYEIDVAHERESAEAYSGFRRVFEKAEWAGPYRNKFLETFDKTTSLPIAQRRRIITAEKEWINSLDDLYKFASYHKNTFSVAGGALLVSDPIVKQDLNNRIIAETGNRLAFIKAKREYSQMQERVLRALAVDPRSLDAR